MDFGHPGAARRCLVCVSLVFFWSVMTTATHRITTTFIILQLSRSVQNANIGQSLLNRRYYMGARRYGIYLFECLTRYFTSECSERVRHKVEHEKRYSISICKQSCIVLFNTSTWKFRHPSPNGVVSYEFYEWYIFHY